MALAQGAPQNGRKPAKFSSKWLWRRGCPKIAPNRPNLVQNGLGPGDAVGRGGRGLVTGGAPLCPVVNNFGWPCARGQKKRNHSVQARPEARPRSPTVRPTVRNAGLSPASQKHEATKNEPAETRVFFARSESVRVDGNNPQG